MRSVVLLPTRLMTNGMAAILGVPTIGRHFHIFDGGSINARQATARDCVAQVESVQAIHIFYPEAAANAPLKFVAVRIWKFSMSIVLIPIVTESSGVAWFKIDVHVCVCQRGRTDKGSAYGVCSGGNPWNEGVRVCGASVSCADVTTARVQKAALR